MSLSEPPPQDGELIAVLRRRDGIPTRVALSDGRDVVAFNIAWGYDAGDQYAHVTTNVSPFVPGAAVDFFSTVNVKRVVDPATGDVLFDQV